MSILPGLMMNEKLKKSLPIHCVTITRSLDFFPLLPATSDSEIGHPSNLPRNINTRNDGFSGAADIYVTMAIYTSNIWSRGREL
jgi:hypothetical protein